MSYSLLLQDSVGCNYSSMSFNDGLTRAALLTKIGVWIIHYFYGVKWDVITHPCPSTVV